MDTSIMQSIDAITNKPLKLTDEGIYSTFENFTETPYDATARVYEWLVQKKWYNKMMWGTSPSDYHKFATEAFKNESDFSLDIGCGGLSQTASLYSSIKNQLILLDYSAKMLQMAKARLKNKCKVLSPNTVFLQADAFTLPFIDNAFSKVVSFGMIHMFDDKESFIKEALRVLKPEGNFYFSVLTTDRSFSKKYLNYLYNAKQVGVPFSSNELLKIFESVSTELKHYLIGSMLFLSGKKMS